jgi:hypothetical protein
MCIGTSRKAPLSEMVQAGTQWRFGMRDREGSALISYPVIVGSWYYVECMGGVSVHACM